MARIIFDGHAYHEAKSKLPEPDGKHCVICGEDLPKRKRKYCSDDCFLKWYRSLGVKDWNFTRWQAFERDNFTCQKCGKQHLPEYVEYDGKTYMEAMPPLIGDHIIPIFLGGAEFDLDNVQTLCIECSKVKTAEEAKLRTKLEKDIRNGNQKRL